MKRVLFVFTVLLVACSQQKTPKGILPPEKMQALLWDYIRVDVYANELLRPDTALKLNEESAKLQQAVFAKHKVTKKDFYKSYQYYLAHKQLLSSMLDTILERQHRAISPAIPASDTGRRIMPAVMDTY